tara:strand:+ start:5834 stop:7261 length:1428 start_codon:yes stop_codon:yes gene_type:complete
MCGRQVGKSVSAAGFSIVDAVCTPFFKTLYVSPSLKQTSTFSTTRVGKILRHSPDIKPFAAGASDNVFLKILANGSELLFSYATDNPDRARGISADRVVYDEVQNIIYDEVVPVINECLANSPYAYTSYMGTPLTMENTIQFLWDNSTQSEWCIKCSGCGKYSFYRTTKGIGKKGIECLHCSKYLNPREGIWVDMNPIPKDATPDDPAYFRMKGFHVPQLILPQNIEDQTRWGRILEKLNLYTESKFKNEVLGVSDSLGTRLLSIEDLNKCCGLATLEKPPVGPFLYTVGGVDWSGGGTKGKSRTAAWIFGVDHSGSITTRWFKIYPDQNPVEVVDDIAKNMCKFGASFIVGDAGEGALANSLLAKKVGGTVKVVQLQYGSSATPLKWNGVDRYLADKTTLIDNYMMTIKKQRVKYLARDLMGMAFKDMLALYEETTPSGKKIWTHSPSNPDDAFHAQVFAWVGSKVMMKDLNFY